tara:strand:- start:256 stop:615 length:360 start_codon:yes stop_codon:yes gene_type:complete
MGWVDSYQSTDTMDISDLRELLSTIGLPFDGKKRDLISYFIFNNWKELIPPPSIKSKDRGLWLEKLYYHQIRLRENPEYRRATGGYHDTINDKDILNHFPSIRKVVSARDFIPYDWNEE